jgi:hypothetical protein
MAIKVTEKKTDSRQDVVLQLPYAESEVGLRLEDGGSERVLLKTACPTEFVVHEPTVEANGDTHMSLEILKFELVGTSELLWPGQTIRVHGGTQSAPGARAIMGSVHIPAGKSLEDGVKSEQVLYLTVESPVGVLHNEKPIRMVGNLYRIPPVGSRFQSTDEVPMLDERGEARVTFWACANEA